MVSIREYTRENTECVQLDSVSEAEIFLGKSVIKIFTKFTEEHPCRKVILIKLICNFIESLFDLGVFPVNLLHISRTPFPTFPTYLRQIFRISLGDYFWG